MIDIQEALRRAAEAGKKMPPNPAWERHVEEVKRFSGAPLNLRRRPDGVWELPK